MSHSILALDLALNSGYSQWAPGDVKPRAGLLKIDPALGLGDRLASLYKWGLRVVAEWGVTDIAIEEPLVAGAGHAAQFHWLISAYGVISMLGAQVKTKGVPINVVPIANRTMIVHWCGTNDIEKKQRKVYSVLEVQRRGFPNITDHNIADSLGVLSLRCCQLGLQTPWDSKRSPGPLFTGIQTGHQKPFGTAITKSNKVAAAKILNRMSFDGEKHE